MSTVRLSNRAQKMTNTMKPYMLQQEEEEEEGWG